MMTEQELRQRWPAAFNDDRRPLMLGIHEQMGIAYPDQAMAAWTRHPIYLRNILIPGAVRIDLMGNVVSQIGLAERKYTREVSMWVRHDLAGVAANAWAQGHRAPKDDETRKRMPKRPED